MKDLPTQLEEQTIKIFKELTGVNSIIGISVD